MKEKTREPKPFSDVDIVLAWLAATPGQWVRDLYLKSRTMVHSRIADLRRRGYVIESKRFGRGDYRYRLLARPGEGYMA